MRMKNCLCLLVCVAALVTITGTTAAQNAAPKKKWYQKIFKPIRNPFKRKQKASPDRMVRNSMSRNGGSQENRMMPSDDPFAGRPMHEADRSEQFNRTEYSRSLPPTTRTNPNGNTVTRAGYQERDDGPFNRERTITGRDGRNMVRNFSNEQTQDGRSWIDNTVRSDGDRYARSGMDERDGYNRAPTITRPGGRDLVGNANGDGRSWIENSNRRDRAPVAQSEYGTRARDMLVGDDTATRPTQQPRSRNVTFDRTEDGRYRTSTTTMPNGNEITRTNRFERDGSSFTREQSTTRPNGQTASRIFSSERGDISRSWNGTTSLPNGETITRTGDFERDGNTMTREQSVTGPNGQTFNRTGTREFGDGTRSFERTITRPNGDQVSRTGLTERDGNTITREQSFFGPDGETRTRTLTRERTPSPTANRDFVPRTADLPTHARGVTRAPASMPRGITPTATRTATRSMTHRTPSLQGVRESAIQRRQVPPASSLRRTPDTIRRPNVSNSVSNRVNDGTKQFQHARRAFRRAQR